MGSIVVSKAEKLLLEKKVKKEVETDKRAHFSVEGETSRHSVIFDKAKNRWSCDCSYNTLQGKICSHIVASKMILSK
ncbi:MAG TPA: SWIM zinc finger family protein [archaeon]|nr:SWIM zinc finger family protein [archaeon]